MNDDLFAANIKIQKINFLRKQKNKIVGTIFVKKIFRNNKKSKKIYTSPKYKNRSGKSKHKNIETVNSGIDGLFCFHFCKNTSPRA